MLSAWARGTGQTGTRNTQAHVDKQPSVHKHTSTAYTQTHHIKTERQLLSDSACELQLLNSAARSSIIRL